MNLRKIIREEIQRILEIEEDREKHFSKRIGDRLLGDYTTFQDEDQSIKNDIFTDIQYLRDVEFDDKNTKLYNIGFFSESPNVYVYHNPTQLTPEGKPEHSEGKYVWYVVRGNELATLVFGHRGYKPRNTQYFIKVDDLRNYLKSKGRMTITDADIRNLTAPDIDIKPKEKDFEMTIGGVKWALDRVGQELYKKNKSTIRYNAWDLLDDKVEDFKLSDKEKEALEIQMIQEGFKRR